MTQPPNTPPWPPQEGYGQGGGWQPPQPPTSPPAGYQGYVPYPMVRPTNTLAIISLVMAFIFSPAALVLGIMARRQIRQTGEQGDGLALAGIVIGGLGTALGALMFLGMFAFVAAGPFMR